MIFDLIALLTVYPAFYYLGGRLDKVESIGEKTASFLSFLLVFLGYLGALFITWGPPAGELSMVLGATFGSYVVYFVIGWVGYEIISAIKGRIAGDENDEGQRKGQKTD